MTVVPEEAVEEKVELDRTATRGDLRTPPGANAESLQELDDARRAMRRTRVIPCLLLRNHGFVKTVGFKNPTYLGDPVNIVKIFNDKEADELVILDITATPQGKGPNFDLLADIASECFMPLGYGGGVSTTEEIRKLFHLGFEKVVLNTAAFEKPDLVREAAELVGSQSVVVSIDCKHRAFRGVEVVTRCGKRRTKKSPVDAARAMVELGAGEILLNSVDRDGSMKGYDLDVIRNVSAAVNVPVVACGGAGSVADLASAVSDGGAAAVSAGSLFVFQGRHRAVLINMPSGDEFHEGGVR